MLRLCNPGLSAINPAEARVGLRGPSASPIEKIKDEYRWQLWYFTNSVTKVVPELAKLRAAFAWPDDLTQVLDVDPVNLA